MLSTTQWTALLTSDLHWKQRYPEIARVVREYLSQADMMKEALKPGAVIAANGMQYSTTGLVDAIMPLAMCRGEAITARNQLFKLLMKLAKNELKDCARRGEEKRGKFGKIHPIFWHAPIAQKCPHCGGVL